jgi:hypothetical protein
MGSGFTSALRSLQLAVFVPPEAVKSTPSSLVIAQVVAPVATMERMVVGPVPVMFATPGAPGGYTASGKSRRAPVEEMLEAVVPLSLKAMVAMLFPGIAVELNEAGDKIHCAM